MLGLKRGMVELVEHDRLWKHSFLEEKTILTTLLQGLNCQIEHVGSTSVPGLAAKPIIDVAVGLPATADMAEVMRRLQDSGYEYRGDKGRKGGHLFTRARDDVVTHHIHCLGLADKEWSNYLAVRQLLSSDHEARQAYEEVKRDLATKFPDDRKSYRDAKGEAIERLLESHEV